MTAKPTAPAGKLEESANAQTPEAGLVDAGRSRAEARRDSGAGAAEVSAHAGRAAQRDARASLPDVMDAATPARDAGNPDAGKRRESAMARDAGVSRDAGTPDAAARAPADSGHASGQDSGQSAGQVDAAVSRNATCAVMVTTNTYEGDPNYHGRLTLKNIGRTTWTLPTIRFDLRSSAYVCNDADVLPGAGWTLRSSAGHCEFTKTSPALSIAANATLSFEYSSDCVDTLAEPAVMNVSVASCD